MTENARSEPLRLVVVNDYQVIVDGVAAMLAAHAGRVEVMRAATGPDAERALESEDADLVLFDPFGSDRSLATSLTELRAVGHHRVVVFTWRRSQAEIAEALAHGVAGYVSKTLPAEELVTTLEAIHRGERLVVPPPRSPRTAPQGNWPGREAGLTPRESEILCLIGKGLTNQEISAFAHVGSESLKTHIRSAYGRIGVTRRTQAIVWCTRNGLISDD